MGYFDFMYFNLLFRFKEDIMNEIRETLLDPENRESLLDPDELAARLRVKKSWIYTQSRKKGVNTIPMIRVGKYCRFLESEVLEWLKSK